MSLQALLFDVDGTLVDTEELHRQAFNQAFLDYGFGWEWDAARYRDLLTVSGGTARMARHIDTIDLPAAEKTRLRRLIPALHREKTRIYGELLGSNTVRMRPGVARLIKQAHQAGLRIGLATTSSSVNASTLVTGLFGPNARDIIGAIVCSDEVSRKKPAPDIYELLLSMLRVPASAAIAFEDSANGLTAAKAAGLFTVVTPTQWTRSQKFVDADLMLPSLGEPDQPLDPASVLRIGGPCLELAMLEKLRSPIMSTLKLREAKS